MLFFVFICFRDPKKLLLTTKAALISYMDIICIGGGCGKRLRRMYPK